MYTLGKIVKKVLKFVGLVVGLVLLFVLTLWVGVRVSPYLAAFIGPVGQVQESAASEAAATATPPTAEVRAPLAHAVTETVSVTETSAVTDTATVLTATPVVTEGRTLSVTVAGADFWAIGVEQVDATWQRLREATNREYCAWSFQFTFAASTGIAAQWPHCVELRVTGTGTVTFTAKPDITGYSTSDSLGTGLAWWPAGAGGEYRVNNGDWVPLTTGPEGVNFPSTSTGVVIELRLTNGYAQIPLGEIKQNVVPKY